MTAPQAPLPGWTRPFSGPGSGATSNQPPQLTDAEFEQFRKLIYEIAGISMADSKKILLAGRLSRRLRQFNLPTFGDYYRMVMQPGNKTELQTMVDLLTTNETYFFRESQHFDFLKQQILPHHPAGKSFDVWSAASSTGEEIYTIAMVLAETLGVDAPWNITGSDISTRVLEIAERGHYLADRIRGLPAEYIRKYCLKGVRTQEGTLMIAPELKRHTRFMQINLNKPLRDIGRFHVIFLRNVMIYFDNGTKKSVVERLVNQLHPGGYLIIGHSETLNGITDVVKPIKPTIYRKPQ